MSISDLDLISVRLWAVVLPGISLAATWLMARF
jgi:hypothetical protein